MVWRRTLMIIGLLLALSVQSGGIVPPAAQALDVGPNGYYIPDYFLTPNWANSPPLAKFVDTLPMLYVSGVSPAPAPGSQYVPVAVPDTTTYPNSDYYEIELGQYTQKMHSGLTNPTTLRGYRQTNTADPVVSQFHYLGPVIISTKGRPVRIKFTNNLPNGDLFLPVDTTIMGSGEFMIDYDPETKAPLLPLGATRAGAFSQSRATLHLHGGLNPWISDGTAHQWTEPVPPSGGSPSGYPKGVSAAYVPDMWFDAVGTNITNVTYPGSNCAGQTTCAVPGATNNPGPGKLTFYWTNEQSARLMFYHDHAYGITRLNVYAGEAAGYLINDPALEDMLAGLGVPGTIGSSPATTDLAHLVPLVIQDKTFVDSATIGTMDPTWAWGTQPGKPTGTPVTGDLWWPHVYMPAQNPYNPDLTGINAMGRWHYGPWFFPPTPLCGSGPDAVPPYCINNGPVPNPYANTLNPNYSPLQPPEMPSSPNPSWGAEAFLDTMVVNGAAFPTITLDPTKYRFRILNAAHDRFLNLQMYRAVSKVGYANPTVAPVFTGPATDLTEVAMVPAAAAPGFPATWPMDGREGGVPDPATRGPAFLQIGSEGGVLPAPVVLPNQPVQWNMDPTMFNFGNVLNQRDGGGTLFLAPAERADVIVDFSDFAGQTLILYNDAPTAFPALDPHYDYYTGAPDRTGMGGYGPVLPGVGPNIRTVMQIVITGSGGAATPDKVDSTLLATLQAASKSTATTQGIFAQTQHPIVVGQTAYNSSYNNTFPATWPYWGLSLILDDAISFQQVDNTLVSNFPMERKAIHDEMGATFDDYGRMSAKLGLEVPFVNAANQNFILQNFVDPPTELVGPDEIQVWRITHNGVDTHPIHFHLFDVQLLNRVGWDGFIRLPDENELGWKDTVRISPLEDTIVALRPVQPPVPFNLPNSVRPLNPTMPLGDTTGFSQIDIADGAGLVPPMMNSLVNFGWEYTWHCHILSHEENDMMRAVAMAVPPEAPSNLVAAVKGGSVVLTWRDRSLNETSFTVQRMNGTGVWTTLATLPQPLLGNAAGGAMSYTDTTFKPNRIPYYYRVFASDTVGGPAPSYPTKTADSTFSNVVGPPAGTTSLSISQAAAAKSPVVLGWTYTGADLTGFTIQRATNSGFTGSSTFKVAGNVTSYSDSQAKSGTLYYYRVMPTNFLGNGSWSNAVSITPHP